MAGAVSQAVLSRNIIYSSANPIYDGLCNLFMLQGIGIGRNLNAPYWSISTEFAAYLLFPVLLAVVFARNLIVPLLGAAISLMALTVCALSHPRLGLDTSTVSGALTRCFSEFLLGLAIFRLVCDARFRRLFAPDAMAATALGVSAVLLLLRYDLLIALSVPLLIAALACNRGRVARLMTHPVLYFLGVISFSIYLLHAPFRPVWLEMIRFLHPQPLSGPAALLLSLVGSIAIVPIAWAGYRLVERPGRGFIRALAARLPRSLTARKRAAPSGQVR